MDGNLSKASLSSPLPCWAGRCPALPGRHHQRHKRANSGPSPPGVLNNRTETLTQCRWLTWDTHVPTAQPSQRLSNDLHSVVRNKLGPSAHSTKSRLSPAVTRDSCSAGWGTLHLLPAHLSRPWQTWRQDPAPPSSS